MNYSEIAYEFLSSRGIGTPEDVAALVVEIRRIRDGDRAEIATLRAALAAIAELSTYDEEEQDEPDEDDMCEALCDIHNIARTHR